MAKPIIQHPDPVLRQKSEEVSDPTSKEVLEIVEEMKKSLASQDDGVALSAVQIGILKRIFIVSGKVKAWINNEDEKDIKDEIEVFINPTIEKISRKTQILEEGCLSIRGTYGKVKRSEKITIKALNQNGEKITRGASGLLAQIFQHEIDHLNGVLFIDKAVDLYEDNSYKQ